MGTYGTIRNKLADAQMRRQCLYAADSRECAYLNRMTKDGDVLRPYPNMYVECQYWGSLNPVEKMWRYCCFRGWLFAGEALNR